MPAKWAVERCRYDQFKAELTKVFPEGLSVREHDVPMDEESLLTLAAQLLIEREGIMRARDEIAPRDVILFEVVPDKGTYRVV
jgi:hypothetical protein